MAPWEPANVETACYYIGEYVDHVAEQLAQNREHFDAMIRAANTFRRPMRKRAPRRNRTRDTSRPQEMRRTKHTARASIDVPSTVRRGAARHIFSQLLALAPRSTNERGV